MSNSIAQAESQVTPARDPAAPIKVALVASAVAAFGLLAWNVLAVLS